jgi:hypothetical protein
LNSWSLTVDKQANWQQKTRMEIEAQLNPENKELKAQVETHLCDEPHDFIINQSHRLSLLEKILKLRE